MRIELSLGRFRLTIDTRRTSKPGPIENTGGLENEGVCFLAAPVFEKGGPSFEPGSADECPLYYLQHFHTEGDEGYD